MIDQVTRTPPEPTIFDHLDTSPHETFVVFLALVGFLGAGLVQNLLYRMHVFLKNRIVRRK